MTAPHHRPYDQDSEGDGTPHTPDNAVYAMAVDPDIAADLALNLCPCRRPACAGTTPPDPAACTDNQLATRIAVYQARPLMAMRSPELPALVAERLDRGLDVPWQAWRYATMRHPANVDMAVHARLVAHAQRLGHI